LDGFFHRRSPVRKHSVVHLNGLGRWKTETGWLNSAKVFGDSLHSCLDVPIGSVEEENWWGGRIMSFFTSKVDKQSHPITVGEREK
jgi:hypothetical protein